MKCANEVSTKSNKKSNEVIKVLKKFPNNAVMLQVISFIYKYNNEINNNMKFELIIPYPRKVLYSSEDMDSNVCSSNLSELNIVNNSVLLVYPIE